MRVINGDLLNITHGIIVHQVNTLGIMGAGLALQLRKKYPELYPEYNKYVKITNKNKDRLLGKVHLYTPGADLFIASCFAQEGISKGMYDKQCYTSYPGLYNSLKTVFELALSHGLGIYLPFRLGCGLAGGDWSMVTQIILKLEKEFEEEVTVIKFRSGKWD